MALFKQHAIPQPGLRLGVTLPARWMAAKYLR